MSCSIGYLLIVEQRKQKSKFSTKGHMRPCKGKQTFLFEKLIKTSSIKNGTQTFAITQILFLVLNSQISWIVNTSVFWILKTKIITRRRSFCESLVSGVVNFMILPITLPRRTPQGYKTITIATANLGFVHTWCQRTVLKYGTRWGLMWTRRFQVPTPNSGSVHLHTHFRRVNMFILTLYWLCNCDWL